jgi:mobilome CxxCx(11)CxxC protein
MADQDPADAVRKHCWEEAFHGFATAHMFEHRAHSLRWKLRTLAFLGIAVPASVGALVLAFGVNDSAVPVVLTIAGILSILQLVGSIWSLTSKWEDQYAYALQSITANHRLSDSFKELGERPPATFDELKTRAAFLDADNGHRSGLDYQQGLTDAEKRRGHRAALRQFRKKCATCSIVPDSLEPTDCGTCGKF